MNPLAFEGEVVQCLNIVTVKDSRPKAGGKNRYLASWGGVLHCCGEHQIRPLFILLGLSYKIGAIFMIWFIGAATAIYLILQLSLNISTIDLVALSHEEVSFERIIHLSESVAGFGVGLLLARLFVAGRKGWKVGIRIVLSLGILYICMQTIPTVQRALVDRWVNDRSPQERRLALVLSAALYGLTTGSLELKDIGLEGDNIDKPEYRTAIILFPPLVLLAGKEEALRELAPIIVASALYKNRDLIKPKFHEARKKSCSYFNDHYPRYVKATKFAEKRSSYNEIVQKYFREWRLDFFGYDAPIPLGLTRKELIEHVHVQGKIRSIIFDEVTKAPLSSQITHVVSRKQIIKYIEALSARKIIAPCIDWPDFSVNFIEPAFRDVEKKLIKILSSDHGIESVLGTNIEEISRRAIYAAVTPPLALVITLFISALSILSFISFALRYRPLCSNVVSVTISAILGIAITAGPFMVSNSAIDNQAYQSYKAEWEKLRTEESITLYPLIGLFEWTLRTAPLLYSLHTSATVVNKIAPVEDKQIITDSKLTKLEAEEIIPQSPDLPPNRFVIKRDEVTDTVTGLIWQRCSLGQTGGDCSGGSADTYRWQEALQAASSPWRLPNIKELRSILEEKGVSPVINQTIFPNTVTGPSYWSASADPKLSAYAWLTSFESGESGYFHKSYRGRVRLVRGGQ